MSFSIDLWNGIDKIKDKFIFTYNKIQILNNVFNTFINLGKRLF